MSKELRISLAEIDFKLYSEQRSQFAKGYGDDYLSPNGKYDFHLEYAGEYPHGDAWYYGQVLEVETGKKVWEYVKGDPIRSLTGYPWSPDSSSCYFSVINNGDRILRYDLTVKKLTTIFGSKKQNRLKGILFVPQNFNGLVFSDNMGDRVVKPDIYCYLQDSETLIDLTTTIDSTKLIASECGIKNCVILIADDSVNLYDPVKGLIVSTTKIGLTLTDYLRGFAHYLPDNDTIYLSLLSEGWHYYALRVHPG